MRKKNIALTNNSKASKSKDKISKEKISVAKLAQIQAKLAVKISPLLTKKIAAGDLAISKQFLPNESELLIDKLELVDPIGDEVHTKMRGVVHRYPDRVLLKPTMECACHCRFCFRGNTLGEKDLSLNELNLAFNYIRSNPEILEVILTGGDPFMLPTEKLLFILEELNAIPSVKLVRIHTRVPTAKPELITQNLLAKINSTLTKPLWVVLHVNSKGELCDEVKAAINLFLNEQIPLLAQSVLLKEVNSTLSALQELFLELVECKVKPYYLHYPDLVCGTSHFRIPLAEAIELYNSLRGKIPGFAIPTFIIDLPKGAGKVDALLGELANKSCVNFLSPLSGQKIEIKYPVKKN